MNFYCLKQAHLWCLFHVLSNRIKIESYFIIRTFYWHSSISAYFELLNIVFKSHQAQFEFEFHQSQVLLNLLLGLWIEFFKNSFWMKSGFKKYEIDTFLDLFWGKSSESFFEKKLYDYSLRIPHYSDDVTLKMPHMTRLNK